MYVERQGTNLAPKVKELELRVEMLENMVKELKSSERPKLGRPPKVIDESKQDMRSL
jgi:hypothetical protein